MLQKAAQEGIYADMALINAGSVRGDIKAGKITAGDVYRLMPFETTMQLVKLSGKQVCLALEQGFESALGRGRAGQGHFHAWQVPVIWLIQKILKICASGICKYQAKTLCFILLIPADPILFLQTAFWPGEVTDTGFLKQPAGKHMTPG
jgi:phosphate-selective porin